VQNHFSTAFAISTFKSLEGQGVNMSEMNDLTIGELAKLTSLSRPTIRYYESVGVIPAPVRGGSGRYRRYQPSDVQRLRFVRRARDLDFSLDSIRQLLALAEADPNAPCDNAEHIARDHIADIDQRLAELSAMRRELAHLIDGCDGRAGRARCTLLNSLATSERA
jgi:DNA-binding transcriptional MerR regulator